MKMMTTPKDRYYISLHTNEENSKKIKSYKNIHKGQRCFIIGGSPSLKQLDLSKLNNEYTFCVNKGYKLAEYGLKHSTYYVISDGNLVEKDRVMDDFPAEFCNQFFIGASLNFPDNKFNTTYFNYSYLLRKDLLDDFIFFPTPTVINNALQAAYYMGFDKIYIIGVDLDYSKITGHAYQESESERQRLIEESVKNEAKMRQSMQKITNFLKSQNREVYNASPAGAVDFIPRVKYEELF